MQIVLPSGRGKRDYSRNESKKKKKEKEMNLGQLVTLMKNAN